MNTKTKPNLLLAAASILGGLIARESSNYQLTRENIDHLSLLSIYHAKLLIKAIQISEAPKPKRKKRRETIVYN